MNEKFKELKDKIVEKWEKFKGWLGRAFAKLGLWIVENPDKAATVAGLAVTGGKLAIKAKRKHDEAERVERRFYDRRSDTYSWSVRKLKPSEKRELETRYRHGELKSDILSDMGLLKY